jgi:excisionase family DNA binding protein
MKLWTLKEIVDLSGFSKSKVQRAISSGELDSKKVGGSRRVKHEWLIKWLGFDPLEGSSGITIKKTTRKGGQETTTVTEIARAQTGA